VCEEGEGGRQRGEEGCSGRVKLGSLEAKEVLRDSSVLCM